jgi:hypothetical protein
MKIFNTDQTHRNKVLLLNKLNITIEVRDYQTPKIRLALIGVGFVDYREM